MWPPDAYASISGLQRPRSQAPPPWSVEALRRDETEFTEGVAPVDCRVFVRCTKPRARLATGVHGSCRSGVPQSPSQTALNGPYEVRRRARATVGPQCRDAAEPEVRRPPTQALLAPAEGLLLGRVVLLTGHGSHGMS